MKSKSYTCIIEAILSVFTAIGENWIYVKERTKKQFLMKKYHYPLKLSVTSLV